MAGRLLSIYIYVSLQFDNSCLLIISRKASTAIVLNTLQNTFNSIIRFYGMIRMELYAIKKQKWIVFMIHIQIATIQQYTDRQMWIFIDSNPLLNPDPNIEWRKSLFDFLKPQNFISVNFAFKPDFLIWTWWHQSHVKITRRPNYILY